MKALVRKVTALLRRIFRPSYIGGPAEVVPAHWWNPAERRRAKLAARILAVGHVSQRQTARPSYTAKTPRKPS